MLYCIRLPCSTRNFCFHFLIYDFRHLKVQPFTISCRCIFCYSFNFFFLRHWCTIAYRFQCADMYVILTSILHFLYLFFLFFIYIYFFNVTRYSLPVKQSFNIVDTNTKCRKENNKCNQ